MRQDRVANIETPDAKSNGGSPTVHRRSKFTRGFVRAQNKRAKYMAMVPENCLIVAMDLSKQRHCIWMSTTDKRPLEHFQVPHSPEGMDELIRRAHGVQLAHGLTGVVFAMEPTSHFWMVVCSYLQHHGMAYVLVQPLSVKRERESTYYRTAKSDYRDAELIANLTADRKFTLTRLPDSPLWATLKAAASAYVLNSFLAIDEQLRIQSFLERLYPDYTTAFKSVQGTTALGCISTIDQVAEHSSMSYLAQVRAVAEGHVHAPKVLRFHHIVAAPQRTWGASIYSTALQLPLRQATERWHQAREHQRELEETLIKSFEQTGYSVYLSTIPNISPVLHAVLLGLLGDPRQYDSARCAVKVAGLDVKMNESGQFQGTTPITRRGNPALRYIAVQIVFALIAHDQVFQRRYAMLTQRRQHPLKPQQALVALACKYLRMVWTMCVERTSYNRTVAEHGTRYRPMNSQST
jgi:transposase